MDTVSVFLEIARHANQRLQRYRERMQKGSRFSPAEQLSYAVVCSVFSAITVEHAIKALVASRHGLDGSPEVTDPLRENWPDKPTRDRLMGFLRKHTDLSDDDMREVGRLFDYRDRLLHSESKPHARDYEDPKHGPLKERGAHFASLTVQDTLDAPDCYEVAKRVVVAVRKASRWVALRIGEPKP